MSLPAWVDGPAMGWEHPSYYDNEDEPADEDNYLDEPDYLDEDLTDEVMW